MSEKIKNTAEVMASRSVQREFRKEIWRKFIAAVKNYHLIEPGDHVAVCISGGKDSLLLATCMREMAKYSDVPFRVSYLSMDPGYTPENRAKMIENARKLGFELHVFDSPIFEALAGKAEVLVHEVNRGKGAALKTAISHVLKNMPECALALTADADGQHSV